MVTPEQAYDAARLCAINALRCAADYIGDLDRIECVVKVRGLVNSGGDFSGQLAVINGFSDLMLEVFGQRGVRFDLGHGAGSFLFRNAIHAFQQGFCLDTMRTSKMLYGPYIIGFSS